MRTYHCQRRSGITRTKEFERKGLATHAVNVGFKCGHGCLYCSTGAMYRTHPIFKRIGENPFGAGYAIVSQNVPEFVARDAQRIKKRGLIQLCTTTDAWSPECQKLDLGRRCLKAILDQPGWTVRILTKNVAVTKDFDLIEQHKDRVFVGLSITATPEQNDIIKTFEPNASPIADRIIAMRQAHARGLRTYAMLCPLMPDIADLPDQIVELIQLAESFAAEEIFVEPVNPRGQGLQHCQDALIKTGYHAEAAVIEAIQTKRIWSHYATKLIKNVQTSIRKYSTINKLRFLLYPANLLAEHKTQIRQDDEGVVWLGKSNRNTQNHG